MLLLLNFFSCYVSVDYLSGEILEIYIVLSKSMSNRDEISFFFVGSASVRGRCCCVMARFSFDASDTLKNKSSP